MADSTLDITQPLDSPRKLLRIIDTQEGEEETKYAVATVNIGKLVPDVYDTIVVSSYDANDNPLVVLYKTGGIGGTTVATLTLVWESATRLTSAART
jgi:hypothetical protein